MAVRYRNLALVLRGDDLAADGTHDVVLIESLHESVLEFDRNKVAAVAISAFLQHVTNHRIAGMANVVPEGLLVSSGSPAGLFICLVAGFAGHVGDGSGSGLVEHLLNLVLTLQALYVAGEVGDFLLHLVVGRGILRRNHAAVLRVGVKKSLCSLPCLRSLFHKFHNLSHNKNPPLMCEKRKALLKIGNRYHVFICFRLFLGNQP